MIYSLQTASTLDIVTLESVRTALQLPSNDTSSDELIKEYIKTAVAYIEEKTNRVLGTSTWKGYEDYFKELQTINKNPVTAISSITYYDSDGNEQTVSSSDYYTDIASEPARVYIENGPTSLFTRPNAVTYNFTAGYTDADNVPPQAKTAIRMLCRHYYDNRGVASPVQLYEVPMGVTSLINQLRIDEL